MFASLEIFRSMEERALGPQYTARTSFSSILTPQSSLLGGSHQFVSVGVPPKLGPQTSSLFTFLKGFLSAFMTLTSVYVFMRPELVSSSKTSLLNSRFVSTRHFRLNMLKLYFSFLLQTCQIQQFHKRHHHLLSCRFNSLGVILDYSFSHISHPVPQRF